MQPGELAALLPSCSGLATLDISYSSCKFSSEDLAAIAGLAQLVTLRLQRCKPMLRDDVVPALVQLRQLQTLDLRDNDLSVAGVRLLLSSLAGGGGCLAELRVGGNWEVTGPAKRMLVRDYTHVDLA
jgi:hypothetical protein